MSYALVHTFTVGEVATAANLNNLGGDITALLSISSVVATAETTASAAFVDLTTVGPAVTVNTGDRTEVSVAIGANFANNTVSAVGLMAPAVSGATTLAAADNLSAVFTSATANAQATLSMVFKITGLTAGSNTFTAKYRTTAGTQTFQRRWLVIGL